jgi:hypothetical protein
MKSALMRPQMNRRWLMLGGSILLGMVATGLSQKALHDRTSQLDVQVRAVNRMVSAVVARRELVRDAQTQPAVVVSHEILATCLWSLRLPVPAANMPLVTMRRYLLPARSLHRTRIA